MWFQSVTADRVCGCRNETGSFKGYGKKAGYDCPAAFLADPSAMSFDFNLFS